MLNCVVVMADDFRTALAEFEERLDKKLDAKLDARFAALRLDERFGQIDRRFEQIDQRFEQIDQRFGQVDRSFVALRLDERFAEARAHTDARFDELKTKLDIVYDGVVGVNERVGALELKLDTFEERVERRFDAIAATARPSGPGRPVHPRRRR